MIIDGVSMDWLILGYPSSLVLRGKSVRRGRSQGAWPQRIYPGLWLLPSPSACWLPRGEQLSSSQTLHNALLAWSAPCKESNLWKWVWINPSPFNYGCQVCFPGLRKWQRHTQRIGRSSDIKKWKFLKGKKVKKIFFDFSRKLWDQFLKVLFLCHILL